GVSLIRIECVPGVANVCVPLTVKRPLPPLTAPTVTVPSPQLMYARIERERVGVGERPEHAAVGLAGGRREAHALRRELVDGGDERGAARIGHAAVHGEVRV